MLKWGSYEWPERSEKVFWGAEHTHNLFLGSASPGGFVVEPIAIVADGKYGKGL